MRRLSAAAIVAFAAILCAGPATALAGPGVLLRQGSTGEQIPVTGAEITAASNSGPTTYTLREQPGDKGTPITLSGVTMSGLLRAAGFNPATVKYVIVVGDDGPNLTLTNSEIMSSPYPEGPAIVSDTGATTRFFRPARRAGGVSDSVESAPGVPLEMTVNGGSLLSIRASASPMQVETGQTVSFSASVRFKPPGASFTYIWDFGDGHSGTGTAVTHTYEISGTMRVSVEVNGSGGYTADCSTVCGGSQYLQVTVTGETRKPDEAPGAPGGSGTTGGLGGTGSGGSGSGTGTGAGFGGTAGATGTPSKAATKPPPQRSVRPEPHERFSSDPTSGAGKVVVQGVLLSGQGTTAEIGLPKSNAGGSPKAAKGVAGVVSDGPSLTLSLAVALALMALGALSERRRVRLRIA